MKLIKENIKEHSIIYTDMWKGYNKLTNNGYYHETVNHSKEFKNKLTGVHTNTIEGNWSALIKTCPSGYRKRKFIKFYLSLFELRRIYKEKLFDTVLSEIIIKNIC